MAPTPRAGSGLIILPGRDLKERPNYPKITGDRPSVLKIHGDGGMGRCGHNTPFSARSVAPVKTKRRNPNAQRRRSPFGRGFEPALFLSEIEHPGQDFVSLPLMEYRHAHVADNKSPQEISDELVDFHDGTSGGIHGPIRFYAEE